MEKPATLQDKTMTKPGFAGARVVAPLCVDSLEPTLSTGESLHEAHPNSRFSDDTTSAATALTRQSLPSTSTFQGTSSDGPPRDEDSFERSSIYSQQLSTLSTLPSKESGAPRDISLILVQGLFSTTLILMLISSGGHALAALQRDPSSTSSVGVLPVALPLSVVTLFISLVLQSVAAAVDIVACTLVQRSQDIESGKWRARRLKASLAVFGEWLMAGAPIAFVVRIGLFASELPTVTPELLNALINKNTGRIRTS